MSIEQFFYEHPLFRHEEFSAWKALHNEIKEASVTSALRYYVNTGRIRPIRRKLYAVVPPNQTAENLTVDPYLIAGKATEDATLGYHTALELLGVGYSSFGQFTYITEQKSKSFEFQDLWFQPVLVSTALHNKQNYSIGVSTINRQGLNLRVTNTARTFVDVLNRIELSGGWEEVCRSITNIAVLNIDEVVEYCLMLDNACLSAKVGYFLSLRQGAFAVSIEKLQLLINTKPKTPLYASKRGKEPFQLVKEWNILLPLTVINQSWEEPYAEV
jgi:predicted transcriptional regulator of viral defense system